MCGLIQSVVKVKGGGAGRVRVRPFSFLMGDDIWVRYRTIGRSALARYEVSVGGVEQTRHIIILCFVICSCGMIGTCGGGGRRSVD